MMVGDHSSERTVQEVTTRLSLRFRWAAPRAVHGVGEPNYGAQCLVGF